MIEREVKFLDVNPTEIREKLLTNGWAHEPESLFACRIMDFSDRRIENERGMLRIRSERGKVKLAFKKHLTKEDNPAIEYQQMKEIEIEVSDYEKMTELLLAIGMSITREVDKKRESFQKNDIHVEIDTYPSQLNVPPMLEIEADDVKKMKTAATEMGFDWKDSINWHGWKVFEKYGVNMKEIKSLRFEEGN